MNTLQNHDQVTAYARCIPCHSWPLPRVSRLRRQTGLRPSRLGPLIPLLGARKAPFWVIDI